MIPTGRYFVGALWASGPLFGLLIAARPDLLPLPTPHLLGPLILAGLLDLGTLAAVRSGRLKPITMNQRMAGVIGAAISALVVSGLLQR